MSTWLDCGTQLCTAQKNYTTCSDPHEQSTRQAQVGLLPVHDTNHRLLIIVACGFKQENKIKHLDSSLGFLFI